MRVISRKRLREFWAKHPNAKSPLEEWERVARKAKWKKFADVKTTYRTADAVNQFVVFNIGGNKFRLVTFIDYERQRLFIRSIMTHKEYDKGNWKKDEFGKHHRGARKKTNGQARKVP